MSNKCLLGGLLTINRYSTPCCCATYLFKAGNTSIDIFCFVGVCPHVLFVWVCFLTVLTVYFLLEMRKFVMFSKYLYLVSCGQLVCCVRIISLFHWFLLVLLLLDIQLSLHFSLLVFNGLFQAYVIPESYGGADTTYNPVRAFY